MTPEERIAEVLPPRSPLVWALLDSLRGHYYLSSQRGTERLDDPGWHPCKCGWEGYWSSWQPHVAEAQESAVVAAVRSWPPEAQAELIGGEVRRRNVSLGVVDRPGQPTGIRIRPEARVVGPWTSTLEDKQP